MYKLLYRLFCISEHAYKYVERLEHEEVPTTCPDNSSHECDLDKTAIIEIN